MSYLKELWVSYQQLLPNFDDAIFNTLNELGVFYKGFINKGVFYKTVRYGPYIQIIEDDGLTGESYKTIGDWTNELTGSMGSGFIPNTFEEDLTEIVENVLGVYELDLDDEDFYNQYPEFEDDRGYLVMEFVAEIQEISIEELEKRLSVV